MELPHEFLDPEVLDIGWIDIHAHLNFLEISPDQALQEAKKKGLRRVITIGTEPKDLPVVQELAAKYSPDVFCTLGIHPHEGKVYNDEVETYLKKHLPGERVVAVGEIGLDYHYNNSPEDLQCEAFRRQMLLAEELSYPVQIHTRDADDDTIEILEEFKGRVRGIIHCFTGTERLAKAALDCGYNLSFSGIVTFKNAQNLRDIAIWAPLDRIHVETDAPFLSPVPLRGRKNQPDHMLWTANCVSELKKQPLAPFCQQMKTNAEEMFPRLLR